MKEFRIDNPYYNYVIGVDDEGKVFHKCFLPANVTDQPHEKALKRIYPYETVVALAESQAYGWRFGDSVFWNEASDGLRFDSKTESDDLTILHLRHQSLPILVRLYYRF